MRRLASAVAWLVVAVAVGAYGLGILGPHLGPDPGQPGALGFTIDAIGAMWVQGGTLAALTGGVAILCRHRAVAVCLTAVALAILLPEAWARLRAPASLHAGTGPSLRVATANLAEQNVDDPLMLDALLELKADVLVLPEYTCAWEHRLDAPLRAHYPHHFLALPPPQRKAFHVDGFRLAVWSRLPPVGEPEVVHLAGVVAQIRVPLRWQGRDLALYGIHPRKPYPFACFAGARADRAALLAWLAAERLPLVIAGDFNATPRSAFFARLRARGLANASETVLGGAPPTWPMDPAWQAPLRVALDHVVHSAAFVAVGFRTGAAAGSDHASVVAELAWRE